MIIQQVPTPPPPDFIPEWVPYIAALGILMTAAVLWPIIRAFARRIEGRGGDAELRAEIDALHQRVAELEQVEGRLAELENRIEFSERLLTQHRDTVPEKGPLA